MPKFTIKYAIFLEETVEAASWDEAYMWAEDELKYDNPALKILDVSWSRDQGD